MTNEHAVLFLFLLGEYYPFPQISSPDILRFEAISSFRCNSSEMTNTNAEQPIASTPKLASISILEDPCMVTSGSLSPSLFQASWIQLSTISTSTFCYQLLSRSPLTLLQLHHNLACSFANQVLRSKPKRLFRS